MKMIVLLFAMFGCLSLSASTNEVSVLKQSVDNSVPPKPVKSAKQPRSQCEATTLSGNRCKRHTAVGSQYCSQHAAIIRKRTEEKKPNK